MTEMSFISGFLGQPVQAGATIILAVLFALQAKKKMRPYLLAIQVALAAIIIGQFAATLSDDGFSPLLFFRNFMAMTFGSFFMHYLIAWLIIILVFFARFRNHNERIFTRNRDS